MENLVINNNELLLMRYTELIRITSCGKDAIRFQSFPDCQVIDENYTLMPQKTDAVIEEHEHYATLTCGTLKVKVEPNGKLTFYKNGKKILEEKPELTFKSNYRHFDNYSLLFLHLYSVLLLMRALRKPFQEPQQPCRYPYRRSLRNRGVRHPCRRR